MLTSIKLALIDLRGHLPRMLSVVLVIAVGVAAVIGVQNLSLALRSQTTEGSRQLTQGDLQIELPATLTQEQSAFLQSLPEQDGITSTRIVLNATLVGDPSGSRHIVARNIGVDPLHWPLTGQVNTDPSQPLSEVITAEDHAVVSPEILELLSVKVGDQLSLVNRQYLITGTVLEAPIISPSGLMDIGPLIITKIPPTKFDNVSTIVVVRVDDLNDLPMWKDRATNLFPRTSTADDLWGSSREVLQNLAAFLALLSLVSLLLGGLGAGTAVYSLLREKTDQIAVLKALGARSWQLLVMVLAQATFLGGVGSLVGLTAGVGITALTPLLFRGFAQIPAVGFSPEAAFSGVMAGVLTALISTLPAITVIFKVHPSRVLRDDPALEGRRAGGAALFLVAVILLTWIGGGLTDTGSIGVPFLLAIAILSGLMVMMIQGGMVLLRYLPQQGLPAFRHAVRTLTGPGNQTTLVTIAIGVSLMLMTTIFVVQGQILEGIRVSGLGEKTPNLYLFGLAPSRVIDVQSFLANNTSVLQMSPPQGQLQAELVEVNGVPPAKANLPLLLAAADPELRANERVVTGEWFTEADKGEPLITLEQRVAQEMGLHTDDLVTVQTKKGRLQLTVKSVSVIEGASIGLSTPTLRVAPGFLDSFVEQYTMTVTTKAGMETKVASSLLQEFPEVMSIPLGSVLETLEAWLKRITGLVQIVTGVTLLTAIIMLAGSLSTTQWKRRREAALMKALGASRRTVLGTSLLENGLMGGLAGLFGSLVGYLLVFITTAVLKVPNGPSSGPVWIGGLIGAAIAMVVGLAYSLDVVRTPPMSVLRSE